MFEHETLSLYAARTRQSLSTFEGSFKILDEYMMQYNFPLKNTFEDIVQFVREPPKTLLVTPAKDNRKKKNQSLTKFSFKMNRQIIL